jgi:hypothetical protein
MKPEVLTTRDTAFRALGSETGGIMNTGSSKSRDRRAWRELYKAALFETDKTKLRSALRKQRKHLP